VSRRSPRRRRIVRRSRGIRRRRPRVHPRRARALGRQPCPACSAHGVARPRRRPGETTRRRRTPSARRSCGAARAVGRGAASVAAARGTEEEAARDQRSEEKCEGDDRCTVHDDDRLYDVARDSALVPRGGAP
jgi:hypothetical protein